jgi:DNA-binding HxlR family transcriptional regulator
MALLDLLGRRWCLRVIWELRGDALGFRPLRERCSDLSPTILNRRLAELRQSRIVELTEEGYALTSGGRDLVELLLPLHRWAENWATRLRR